MINSDEVHFVRAKKKGQLRIKDQLGPFICNSREVGREGDEILQRLKLKQSLMWTYDPYNLICNRRQKNKLSPYIHHRIPEIEQYANQYEWDSINYVWPSIQIIFEQTELVKMATEAIHKIVEELGNKQEEANESITFLNNKNRYELDELDIPDRTTTIIDIKKVLTKGNLMLNLEKRCQSIQTDIDNFM